MDENKIDVGEILESHETEVNAPDDWGLDDTPDDAAETAAPAAPQQETFRLKHLGEELEVTREEMTALAQKGRDYDRVRERLHSLESLGGSDPKVMREVHDFVSEYGMNIDPASIPQQVWNEVRAGSSLLTAYQRYENNRLRSQIQREANRARTFGVKNGVASQSNHGAIESDWFNQ